MLYFLYNLDLPTGIKISSKECDPKMFANQISIKFSIFLKRLYFKDIEERGFTLMTHNVR